jgi:hypothetical protein
MNLRRCTKELVDQRFNVSEESQQAAFDASVAGVDTYERLSANLLSDMFTAMYALAFGVGISSYVAGLTLVPISAHLELTLPLSAQLKLTLSPI